MTYLDNAATTRPDPRVVAAVQRALESDWANPSSSHRPGLAARELVEEARRTIAASCRIEPQGVVFTSGGTEANHLAAFGLPLRSRTTRIVTTVAEHPSLGRPLAARSGAETIPVPLTRDGTIDLERLDAALDERVGLVALFEGHNEIGSRNPLGEVVERVRRRAPRALIHVDAVQSFGKPSTPPFELGIDSASVSAHKIHGPKGVGALLLSTRAQLAPQLLGGGQEGDRRSGTENVPGIAGFGEAVRLIAARTSEDHAHLRALRDRLERELLARVADSRVLASGPTALPHIVALVVPGALAEVVLHHLELAGIAASAGAACHAGAHKLSGALRAIGLRDDEIRGMLRLSLSRMTTAEEIDRVIETLPRVVAQVRALGAVR
jgi:cysteine desulfurase